MGLKLHISPEDFRIFETRYPEAVRFLRAAELRQEVRMLERRVYGGWADDWEKNRLKELSAILPEETLKGN